jgi:hypothetical protein
MARSRVQIGFDAVELLTDPGALALDVGQSCADLVLGYRAVSGEIKQVLFFGVAVLQRGCQLLLKEQIGGLFFAEGFADSGSS